LIDDTFLTFEGVFTGWKIRSDTVKSGETAGFERLIGRNDKDGNLRSNKREGADMSKTRDEMRR